MSGLGNKQIFAKNLSLYMNVRGVSQKELAEVVGVGTSTVNDWVKANKYPRIDAIEKLANYFGILKSDLIEEKSEAEQSRSKKNDAIADAIIRMKCDDEFFSVVELLYSLDTEQLGGVKQMLSAFTK